MLERDAEPRGGPREDDGRANHAGPRPPADGDGVPGAEVSDPEDADIIVPRAGRGRDRRRYAKQTRQIPIFRLLGYYALLAAGASALMYLFPILQYAFMAPLGVSTGATGNPFDANMSDVFARSTPDGGLHRLAVTALVIGGSLLLVLPVAWVYTFVRRLRYDRSLVHSLVMLPPVVAGTVMVVKNSLALAFSLAGIVAAVRFRTTVKDPKDAVHVFLVMAVGLAAGVQALDIALLLSLTFSLIVLVFWKYDLEVYADDEAELLSVGDSNLMLADTHEGRLRVQRRMDSLADEIKTDGILLIHTMEPESARQVAEVVLSEVGKDWRFRDPARGRNGVYTLEAVVRLRKKKTPVDLLGELEDRWSPMVAAAEYVPYTE